MTNELDVDPAGLYAGALSSEATAADLIGGTLTRSTNTQHSAIGVGAVNAALARMQVQQSARIVRQAGAMSIGAADYASTDTDGAQAITTVLV